MTYQKSTKNGLQKVIENDIEKLGKHLFFLLDEITQKSPNNNKSYLLNNEILIQKLQKLLVKYLLTYLLTYLLRNRNEKY